MKQLWIFISLLVIWGACPQTVRAANTSNETLNALQDAYSRASRSNQSNYFVPTSVQTSGGGPHITVVDKASHGKRLGIQIQDEIHIQLRGNGSTGYWWYFDEPENDNDIVALVGESNEDLHQLTPGRRMFVGAPVTYKWKLRAVRRGSRIIRMKYYRRWEGSDSAIDEFEIGLDVN